MIIDQLKELATSIISNEYKNNKLIDDLQEKYRCSGFVKLPKFFTRSVLSLLLDEVYRLYSYRDKKNFIMPGYQSPRIMSVIGGQKIIRNSFIFPAVYVDKELKEILSKITNTPIFNIAHEEELMVINCLEKESSTHGWHLDDPKYALVIILEAPLMSNGGYLEVIPDWVNYCRSQCLHPVNDSNAAVSKAREDNLIAKIHHEAGSCYLLNASECLHRVAPVVGEVRRIAVNFTFHDSQKIKYGKTADLLYGNELATELIS
ncbi:hypothetical protein AB835_13590 [Candidatus Endobugula sertula]|uniref:Fe2OG dioxygenase domain-containing protein n=1 Tax=Candidatus Endobugula sertula TaxID=62101 RepID=A0A1D2QLV2_9GAMM|nr:hypothetical protein AB835_13590 [Candidatus Endobugula sertula]